MRYTSPENRAAIVALLKANHSQKDVAAAQHVSKSTVSRLASRVRQGLDYHHKPISGRPRKLSPRALSRDQCGRRVAAGVKR